jgi:ankyrin repeat protein
LVVEPSDVVGNVEGVIIDTNGRLEFDSPRGRFQITLGYLSNAPATLIPLIISNKSAVTVVPSDAASQVVVLEAKMRRMEDKLRTTTIALTETQARLVDEMDKRVEGQKETHKYMLQLAEAQTQLLNMHNSVFSSTPSTAYPSHFTSLVRDYSGTNQDNLPYSEWVRLGYDNVLVAAMFGQTRVLDWLSSLHTPLNGRGHNGESALYLAAEFGHLDTVQWFLKQGETRQNVRTLLGVTPLLIAVANGHLAVVEWMLSNGWSTAERMPNGNTLLHVAARYGQDQISASILGTSPDLSLDVNINGESALHVAARFDQISSALLLLRLGLSLQTVDRMGLTPFLSAVSSGKSRIAEIFLKAGASLAETDADGSTAFIIACFRGNMELAQYMISKGATIDETNSEGNSALSVSCFSGDLPTVTWLHSQGANVHHLNAAGNTPMLLAAYGGHADVLDFLVNSAGVSLDQRNPHGSTPLLVAAMSGHVEAIEWCLQKGSVLEETDYAGISPMIASCIGGHVPAVQYMLSKGAKLEEATRDGYTPLLMAAYCGCSTVVQFLLETGASPLRSNASGSTALMLAAMSGHMLTIQSLISFGMSVNERARAAKVASARGNETIADYLRTRAYSRDHVKMARKAMV